MNLDGSEKVMGFKDEYMDAVLTYYSIYLIII
jgi:hypothetical protein